MPSLTLKPGSLVRLKGQPERIPDFLVIRFEGDRCWVRQQTWSPETQLPVRVTQLAIPDPSLSVSSQVAPDNVISLDLYRRRKRLRP